MAISLLSHYSPRIDPLDFWPSAFLGLAFPVLVGLNFGFVVYWLIRKPKYAIYSGIFFLFSWGSLKNLISFNLEKDVKSHDHIALISFNIGNGIGIYHKDKKKREASLKKFKSATKAWNDYDIICLQEVSLFGLDIVNRSFGKLKKTKAQNGLNYILTKTEAINNGEVNFKNTNNSCIWADVVINFDTLRIYNVHLQSNMIDQKEIADLDENLQEYEESLREAKGILSKYKQHVLKRSAQVKLVKRHISKSPYPVIVSGDFNDPPQSFVYRHIAEGLFDGFVKCGKGLGATYAGNIPLLRIDYIFADPSFDFISYKIERSIFSDHYPTMAALKLGNRSQEEDH